MHGVLHFQHDFNSNMSLGILIASFFHLPHRGKLESNLFNKHMDANPEPTAW